MRKERMNNKGFSLVELIIVIAIMAILAAALAPQLMKYIEKSRVSTDASTCTSIESCVNAALANEVAYKQVAQKATTSGKSDFVFYIKAGPKFGNITPNDTTVDDANCSELANELKDSLSSIKDPKQTGMTVYKVTIVVKQETKTNVGITNTSATSEEVTQVGDIKVQTIKEAPASVTFN